MSDELGYTARVREALVFGGGLTRFRAVSIESGRGELGA